MGAHGGPNMTEDGVVFYYDTGNGKSYAGEPTENLALNPTFSSTASWSVSSNGGGSFSASGNYGKINAGSVGSYSYLYQYQAIAVSSNESVTWSINFKNNVVGDFAIRLVLFLDGVVKTQPSVYFSLDGTGGIVRKSVTSSHVDGASHIRTDVMQGSYYGGIDTDTDLEFTNAQLERNTHATPFTPGTRSVTEGLKDLTGRATLNTAYTSFNSDAEISFDGTGTMNNIYTVGGVPDHLKLYGDHTIEAVFNPDNALIVDGSCSILRVGMNADILYSLFYANSTRRLSYQYYKDQFRSAASNSDVIAHDVNNHVIAVKSGLTVSFYVNGVYQGGGTVLQGSTNPGLLGIGAARSGTYTGTNAQDFAGEIPIVKIYNRALTAEEVAENFNGIRSRFGI